MSVGALSPVTPARFEGSLQRLHSCKKCTRSCRGNAPCALRPRLQAFYAVYSTFSTLSSIITLHRQHVRTFSSGIGRVPAVREILGRNRADMGTPPPPAEYGTVPLHVLGRVRVCVLSLRSVTPPPQSRTCTFRN